ncbi:hypothetical protein B0H14DRAFT_3430881 [Mycena olivaceomarginata]|nr:hypothetical protein B0H14DRAFT_3430881 [Mycena olivaceomarginata]
MTTTTNLFPTIESTATPADKWPSSTNAQKPQEMGPEELAPQQQNSESTLLDTAKTYLPGPDDVQRAMTSVGQAAKTYLPQSVAAYLPSASSSSLETDPDLAPLHPPFLADLHVTDHSELRTLSTKAQAGSHVDSVATTSTSADDAPAPTSVVNDRSASVPTSILPPFALPSASTVRSSGFALPDASSPSSAHGSTPQPGSADSKFVDGIPSPMPSPAAAEPSSIPQTEGSSALRNPVESPTPVPFNTPAVPGSIPINPGLGSANGAPDVVAPRAPQGYIAPRDGVANGKDAPLPVDAPHFRVFDSDTAPESTETAPPVPPKTDLPHLTPLRGAPTVASPPLPPTPTTAAHDDSGTDEDSGSGSGSDAEDAAAGKEQRRKKPKLLQRLKDKMHVGHSHT